MMILASAAESGITSHQKVAWSSRYATAAHRRQHSSVRTETAGGENTNERTSMLSLRPTSCARSCRVPLRETHGYGKPKERRCCSQSWRPSFQIGAGDFEQLLRRFGV